jgi:hypothetical protein
VQSIGSGLVDQKRTVNISAAASLLNNSFNQFFSSVFRQNKKEESSQSANPAEKEDPSNPFTEARQKLESSSSPTSSESKTNVAEKKSGAQDSAQESKQGSTDPASGAGIQSSEAFLIVGDFAGSGILSSISARRAGDATFITDDGERDFNLLVNVDAVRNQSAFCIDDLNGDGIADFLITNKSYLFGRALLGDGNGGYVGAGSFPTWYRAMFPLAGTARNGMRDIVAVDAQSGFLAKYVWEDHYRFSETGKLSFLPDYLLHLVAPDTSREFVMAAQTAGTEQILGWGDDHRLQPVADTLGVDPTVLVSSFGADSLQAYQVGSYASVVLARNGKSFNVANLRMLPRTFLVIGDFNRQGSLDVAVGILSNFTPKKKQ